MKKIIAIILIVASVGLAVWGYQKYEANRADLSIGNIEISAQEKSYSHYLIWAACGICLGSGIGLLVRK